MSEGLVDAISSSTVRRWLHADAIKPRRYRSWIFPRDPNFADKAARVLDLYARTFEGVALGPNDYVISADEKSQLQALHRCHLIGTIAEKTGIVPFMELVDKVMTQEPYASARRVYWVVDNGSSHNGQRSIDRMTTAWPTARLVHLPVHASWLNQIEIVFSIIQRKVIKPADFADLAVLADRLCRFEDRYNQTARPFDWRFTRGDLTNMLQRLDTDQREATLAA